MGKTLIHQKRGKGLPAYRAPSHRFKSDARYPDSMEKTRGQVVGFVFDPSRTALLAEVLLEDGSRWLCIAAEGLALNDEIEVNTGKAGMGCVARLGDAPDGSMVFNIELRPGDGGRLLRSSGACATVVSHDEDTGLVVLKFNTKSKVTRSMPPACRATIGVASGGGRTEKPFKKAGAKMKAMKARNRYYPKVRGSAMNAYDHPHGGKSIGKPSTVARGTPPGRKVGHIAARQTGRKKRRERKTVV